MSFTSPDFFDCFLLCLVHSVLSTLQILCTRMHSVLQHSANPVHSHALSIQGTRLNTCQVTWSTITALCNRYCSNKHTQHCVGSLGQARNFSTAQVYIPGDMRLRMTILDSMFRITNFDSANFCTSKEHFDPDFWLIFLLVQKLTIKEI